MKKIKTKVGTFYSELDLPFQVSDRKLTLNDFDGDQITYNMYLEGRRSIIEYEKRMNNEKITSSTLEKNLQNTSELDEASNGSQNE